MDGGDDDVVGRLDEGGEEALAEELADEDPEQMVREMGYHPLMGRVHYGVIDIFQFELPADLVAVFREMCRRARLLDASDLGRYKAFHLAREKIRRNDNDESASRRLYKETIGAPVYATPTIDPTGSRGQV